MFDQFDRNELLALIEGELDAKRAERLRQELAAVPEAWTQIEAMIADRQAMRGMPQPDLPRDLLAELESHLARPMLMGQPPRNRSARPGYYRRAHRRRRWRATLAMAAMLAVVATAGFWIVSNNWRAFIGDTSDNLLATNGPADASRDTSSTGATDLARQNGERGTAPSLPADTPVHHYLPDIADTPNGSALAGAATENEPPGASRSGTPEPLPFALVITTSAQDDSAVAELETSLQRALKQGERATALVRNFSFDEARRIQQRYYANRRSTPDETEPAWASVDPNRRRSQQMKELASNVQRQYQQTSSRESSGAGDREPVSGTLLGSDALAASLAQQLDFSSRGATHTVTVPRAQLIAWLERLNASMSAVGAQTMVRMLPEPPDDPSQTVSVDLSVNPGAWLTHTRAVREVLEQLNSADAPSEVLLPVVIEPVQAP